MISPRIVSMLYERCREEILLFDKARLNLSNLSLQDLNVPVDFVCNVAKRTTNEA